MAVGLLSEFLCRSRGIIKGVRLHKFSLSGSPRFGLSALKTLLCGFDFDVIACRQEPEWVDPVPSIPLSEAQLLRESTIEPPPSIRQPRNTARKIRNVRPIGTWALFDNNKVTHTLHLSFLSPACLIALFNVPGGMSTFGFPATVTVPFFVG